MHDQSSFWNNKKVFVTGSTGFKGSWLSIWLHSMGAKVYGYALKPITKNDNFVVTNLENKINQEYGDICDFSKLESAIERIKPEIIFHLAAQPIVKDAYDNPLLTIKTNILGTANLFEICKDKSYLKVIINVTSDKCYLNLDQNTKFKEDDKLGGKDIYSASKACAEIINFAYYHSFFKDKDLSIASVRAGNVIGGGDWQKNRIIPDAMRAIKNKSTLLIRMPNATRPWQHVIEPLMGYLILAQKMYLNPKKFNGPWNLGPSNDKNMTVGELVSKLNNKIPELKIEIINNNINEPNYLRLSSKKAKQRLGWEKLFSDDDMIDLIYEWHRDYQKKDVYKICLDQINFYLNKANSKIN